MNYYERHLGDYAKDTGHLTMLEHGAYTLLLDRYYGTEQPIPQNQVHRVCRARTREEKAAVNAVLAEFFTLESDAWVNGRSAREISKAQTKIAAARENGKRGGRPKMNPEPPDKEPSGFSVGSISGTQAKALQSPDTRYQIPNPKSGEDGAGSPPLPRPLAREPDPETPGPDAAPTAAGLACRAIRAAGVADVNPGHPGLLRLLDAGVGVPELAETAAELAGKGRPKFALLLATVEGRRRDAAAAGAVPAAPPPPDWRESRREVVDRACRLGIGPWDEVAAHIGSGPSWGAYRKQVIVGWESQQQQGQAA